jgi:hypothetical protein
MRFSPEILSDSETMRLMEARNHQSHSLIEASRNLLLQATEIDLSNIATEILHKYPDAHSMVLLNDQRTDFKGVIFCGHLDDADGHKVADSFNAKDFVEALLLGYKIPDRKSVVNRRIDLREYAAKKPSWFDSTVNV